MPLLDGDDDDDGDEMVGAVGTAEIGALATGAGAAGLALVALFPQSPPNGEYDLPLDDDAMDDGGDEKVGAVGAAGIGAL